jgi:hypothetical protein
MLVLPPPPLAGEVGRGRGGVGVSGQTILVTFFVVCSERLD